jgi:hypothetical protein
MAHVLRSCLCIVLFACSGAIPAFAQQWDVPPVVMRAPRNYGVDDLPREVPRGRTDSYRPAGWDKIRIESGYYPWAFEQPRQDRQAAARSAQPGDAPVPLSWRGHNPLRWEAEFQRRLQEEQQMRDYQRERLQQMWERAPVTGAPVTEAMLRAAALPAAAPSAQAPVPSRAFMQFEDFVRRRAAISLGAALPGGLCPGGVAGAEPRKRDPDPGVVLSMVRECYGTNSFGYR